ncbi:MAG: hypothetical protein JW880_06520 [Candidatus Thermoplasmatota archaeon]|nr:hypothetical protein [Candidatus Thermoplasmatota archaeon]
MTSPSIPSGPSEGSLDRRTESLSRIFELTRDLLKVEDVSVFLCRTAETVREIFGFDRVAISTMDETKGVFTDHALAGYPKEAEAEIRGSLDAFEIGVILEDFREDCRVSKIAYYIPAEKQAGGADDFLAVRDPEAAMKPRASPDSWHELDLLYFGLYNRHGSMIGFLQVDYPLDGKIPTTETIEEIELFASIAAVAIENSGVYRRSMLLLRENEVKTDRLVKMLDLIQSVLRIDDLDLVLQKVSDAMAYTFGFRKTGVSLFSEDTDKVTVHSMTGYSQAESEVILSSTILKDKILADFREEFRVTRTGFFIPGEVQGNGSDFVFMESPDKAARTRDAPDSWHELDLLYFAMYDRAGKMLGYIQLDYPLDDRIPTKETMEAMEAFASIATIAIENSKVFDDLTRARDHVKMYLDLLTHDVGNLVNPVNAYLEIVLGTTSLTDTQFKYITSAQEAAKSVQHIVRNVRRSAQMLEASDVELVPTNLTKSIQQASMEASTAFLGKKINIRYSVPQQDVWVVADTLLTEVLYNLLTNSIKYDEHEEVVIDVEVKGVDFEGKEWTSVRIVDRGVGIPDDLKDKVFSKDYMRLARLDRPILQKARGAGMGLSIVKALVDRYGGKIWAENRVYDDYTRGSVFSVLFGKP